MKFLTKYVQNDNLITWLYENLVMVILANISFIISYHIKFANFIPEYNYKPFVYISPFYSILVIMFVNYFNIFKSGSLEKLIINSTKVSLLITSASMAIAYVFRLYMCGIPTTVFIITTVINILFFVEIIRFRGLYNKK